MRMPNLVVRSGKAARWEHMFPELVSGWSSHSSTSSTSSIGYNVNLYMPAVSTTRMPGDKATHVIKAYNRVKAGPRHGIKREHGGVIEATMDHEKSPYVAVTRYAPVVTSTGIEPIAYNMGLNRGVPTYTKLPTGETINNVSRAMGHEAKHVMSTELLKYMDVPRRTQTLIMESFAEFTELLDGFKKEVLLTTPYEGAVKFGYMVDSFYKSFITGNKGFAAFVADVQHKDGVGYGSAHKALENLSMNMREEMHRGTDIKGVVLGKYNRDLREAMSGKHVN